MRGRITVGSRPVCGSCTGFGRQVKPAGGLLGRIHLLFIMAVRATLAATQWLLEGTVIGTVHKQDKSDNEKAGSAGGRLRHWTGQAALALAVLTSSCVGPPLLVDPTELPSAIVGKPYTQYLDADGIRARWEISAGALPPGLRLDAAGGTISGLPTQAGTYQFTVAVRSTGLPVRTGDRLYALTVVPALTIDAEIEPARVGVPYDDRPRIAGGVPPYRVELVGHPAYLDYDRLTGRITGTLQPLGSGVQYPNATLFWTVSDSGDPQQTVEAVSVLEIHPPPVTITTESLPPAPIGESYTAQLEARDGRGPYQWEIVDGVLPGLAGDEHRLKLDRDTGVISGKPGVNATTRTFTVRVTDSDSWQSSDTKELKIVVPVKILTDTLPAAAVGSTYGGDGVVLSATGGLPPYTWSLLSGHALPDGLELNSNSGVISGTPTAGAIGGTFTVVVTDSDEPATRDERELTIDVQ